MIAVGGQDSHLLNWLRTRTNLFRHRASFSSHAAADNSSKNVGGQDCKRTTIAYFFSVPLLSFHTPPPTAL